MTLLGTALRPTATRVTLLDSSELDKKVTIECQCLGVETVAADRYVDTPAMHVAHRFHVVNMLNGDTLRRVAELEKPHYIALETEAIAADMPIQSEEEGLNAVPCTHATELAMNREDTRRLAAGELQLPTSICRFTDSKNLFREMVTTIGYPCIVKPVMSFSGKEQTFVRSVEQLAHVWEYAQRGGRAGAGRVIVEGVVKFSFKITLLAVNAVDDVHFCAPVGRHQEDGDYRESRQPQQVSPLAPGRAQGIARKVALALGGYRLLGVELFVCGDKVIFNEVSSRPHDTGMMMLTSQDPSEFALHTHVLLGLPVGGIRQYGPAASAVILPQLTSQNVMLDNVQNVVGIDLQICLFGEPEIDGSRRLEVALVTAESVVDAIERAKHAAGQVGVQG